MNYCLEPLKKYAVFKGRSRRREYWLFSLFMAVVNYDIAVLFLLIGLETGAFALLSMLWNLVALVTAVPSVAVLVRRLHDVGKSGWYALAIFVPILGWLYCLFLLVKESEPCANVYGPNPKEEIAQ